MPYIIGFGALVLIAVIYLFAVSPRLGKKFNLPEKGYAHRGLWDKEKPENSLPAFAAAVENGFGIETDIHLSADGIPVVFHDNTLERMCGDKRTVEECTYEELSKLSLAGSGEKIPLFSEFLELVGGKVPLLIELKGESFSAELCDVIAPMLDKYNGEFVIESFNPLLLKRMGQLRPQIIRGQLVTCPNRRKYPGSRVRNFALAAMLTNFLSRPDFIAYDLEYPNGMGIFVATRVLRARRCVWTPRDPETYRKFISRGDCPIFEGFVPCGVNEDCRKDA